MAQGIECRKTCASHAPHYEGIYCGTADTLLGCEAVCSHITCKEDLEQLTMADTKKRPNQGGVGGFSRATGGFKRRRLGGTGQPARFANQSGNGGGKIFGLTTQQALIAIGVGVAAYFIIKKVK